jgi:AcrR family transcriptional regulator
VRREELLEKATDHALATGLIGLSLRPLAAAIGTSDRMLIYHFGSRDALVAGILRTSNDRSVARLRALPPSPGVQRAVLDLWAACTSEETARCQRMYVEASALGLLGTEPYVSVVREANDGWLTALADHLVASGMPRRQAARAVVLLDATFMGLQLDLPLTDAGPAIDRAVHDLAAALAQDG